MSSQTGPTVGSVSEGEILRRIMTRLGPSAALVGPGDDAAVIAASGGSVVATTDTLVHGPDFRLAWSSGFDLGWKAAAVNLADIAAMGARPTALLVALALPNDTLVSFVEDLASGLRAACERLAPGCTVDGGDLTVSDTLTIAVTALGSLDGRAPVLRSGAQAGDVVAIAGEVGIAARGLAILFDRFTDDDGSPIPLGGDLLAMPPGERDAAAVIAQLRPNPPIPMGVLAADHGATAMMDVSDGLVLDASRMADASRVTISLDSASLAPDESGIAWALEGGEDHALLAAFPAGASLQDGFRAIGRVVERGAAAVLVDATPYSGRAGWDPYRDWDAAGG